ncbi:MAG: hypothetical protein P1V97_10945 [Planctomycetota bacterium]|nr:hypothetical protein [Planctomycetota bacterium]
MQQELEELKRRYDSDPENLDLLYAYDRACERYDLRIDGHTLREWLGYFAASALKSSTGERILLENLPYSFPALYELSLSQEPQQSRATFALMLNHRRQDTVFPILGQVFSKLPEHLRELCSGWIVLHAKENPSPAFLTLVPKLRELAHSEDSRESGAAILTLSRWGFGEAYRGDILAGAESEDRFLANHCFRALAYIRPDKKSLEIFRLAAEKDSLLPAWLFRKWHDFLEDSDLVEISSLLEEAIFPFPAFLVSLIRRIPNAVPLYGPKLASYLSDDFPLTVQRDALFSLIRGGFDGPGIEDH